MTETSTVFPFTPITITSQDDVTVSFNITNPFGNKVLSVYYQYAAAGTGNTKCYSESPFLSCPEPIEVTAHCLTGPVHSLAVVDIWFVDPDAVDSSDSATVPECCQPDTMDSGVPTVLYSFKVYCQSKCERRAYRELHDHTVHAKSVEDFKDDASETLVDKSEKAQEHFCSSAEYPCGDGSLVHVCHYSAKDGYQTYCVPESDSDVISYMPKDYCGPCVGGYGGVTSHS